MHPADTSNWKPPVCEHPTPERQIRRFDELAPGMNLEIWAGGRWQPARVREVGTSPKGFKRAVLFLEHGSGMVYEHAWDRRDRNRVRLGAGKVLPNRPAELRQAAKKMNFGSPAPRHPTAPALLYDGLTADECLELYTKIQREQEPGLVYNMLTGTMVPRMTAEQLRVAKALWGAALDVKRVKAFLKEDERKRAEQIVCDDDRWEI